MYIITYEIKYNIYIIPLLQVLLSCKLQDRVGGHAVPVFFLCILPYAREGILGRARVKPD